MSSASPRCRTKKAPALKAHHSQADPSREGSLPVRHSLFSGWPVVPEHLATPDPRDPLIRGAHDVLKPCPKIRPLVKTRFPARGDARPPQIRRVVPIPMPKLSAITVDPSGASPYQPPFTFHLSLLTSHALLPPSRRPDSQPKGFVWLHPEGNNRAERKQSHGADKRQSPIVRSIDNIPERYRRKNGRQR
jgi:hypothetical protein